MVLESSPPLIEVDRLSLILGLRTTRGGKVLSPGTRLFEDLSWRLDAGCHATIDGPSGSGKTSFLRLLSGLISPTSGTIAWQGQPYSSRVRQDLVYVAQTPKLLGMTVAEAIAYPLKLRLIPEPQIKNRVADILDRFEIPTSWLSQTELQLSQGSQQWVSLARALVLNPIVLLLDEPTATLDSSQQYCLMNALQSLTQTTLAIASHDLNWANALTSKGPIQNNLTLASRTTRQYSRQDTRDDETW